MARVTRPLPAAHRAPANRHASAHFSATHHALVRTLQPKEGWSWCFADEVAMIVPAVHGQTRIPRHRSKPDAPEGWQVRPTRVPLPQLPVRRLVHEGMAPSCTRCAGPVVLRASFMTALGWLALAGSAEGRSAWTPPVTLDRVAEASSPVVAMAPNGRSAVMWQRSRSLGRDPYTLKVAFGGPRGGFGPAHSLARSSAFGLVELVVDSGGGALAMWMTRPSHGPDLLYGATRTPDGEWRRPRLLAGRRQIAVWSFVRSPRGDAYILYTDRGGLYLAVRRRGAPWFSRRHRLSRRKDFDDLTMAVNRRGDVTLVWDRSTEKTQSVHTRTIFVGGRSSSVQLLDRQPTIETTDDDGNPDTLLPIRDPAIGIDRSNRATVIWKDLERVRLVKRTGRRPFGAIAVVARSRREDDDVELAVSARGDTAVLWTNDTYHGSTKLRIRVRGANRRAFLAPHTLGVAADTYPDIMTADPLGNIIVLWRTASDNAIYGVRRSARGTYTHAQRIARGDGSDSVNGGPDLATDARGHAITAFIRAPDTINIVQVASLR